MREKNDTFGINLSTLSQFADIMANILLLMFPGIYLFGKTLHGKQKTNTKSVCIIQLYFIFALSFLLRPKIFGVDDKKDNIDPFAAGNPNKAKNYHIDEKMDQNSIELQKNYQK